MSTTRLCLNQKEQQPSNCLATKPCRKDTNSLKNLILSSQKGEKIPSAVDNGRIIFYENGDVYEGQKWKKGSVYKGRFTFFNGSVYNGEFLNKKFHGSGEMSFSNGDFYKGEFKDGAFNGTGTLVQADGPFYKGGWEDGKRHGFGELKDVDGSSYEGDWVQGLKNGQGSLKTATGTIYEGGWTDGERHGFGKESNSEGEVYEGGWVKGCKEGYGKQTDSEGTTYEGGWRKGVKSGLGKLAHFSGECYEGGFKNGLAHGKGRFLFFDGSYCIGKFREGRIVGEGTLITKDDPDHGTHEFIVKDRHPRAPIFVDHLGIFDDDGELADNKEGMTHCSNRNGKAMCAICSLELVESDPDLSWLACGHAFHKECILDWLTHKKECPVCRASCSVLYSNTGAISLKVRKKFRKKKSSDKGGRDKIEKENHRSRCCLKKTRCCKNRSRENYRRHRMGR